MKNVVLVDGGSGLRGKVDRILDGAGYRTRAAPSGRAALSLLPGLTPPIVLVLDKRLPDMSAREFVAHLQGDWRLQDAVVVLIADESVSGPELVSSLGYAFAEATLYWERVSA